MTTDQHRRSARRLAREFYENKVKKGYDFSSHISTDISFEEQMYRGLLAEYDFAEKFGLKVNEEILDYGDGGRDFFLDLYVNGVKRTFVVNIKNKRVKVSWEVLSRHPTHLRVPIGECKPKTIYVFATYDEPTDTAEVRRWAWGKTLLDRNETMVFENSNGIRNYVLPFEELRELQELKDRMSLAGFVGYDEQGRFLHYCQCGEWGSISVGAFTHKGILGKWYCGPCHPSPMSSSR